MYIANMKVGLIACFHTDNSKITNQEKTQLSSSTLHVFVRSLSSKPTYWSHRLPSWPQAHPVCRLGQPNHEPSHTGHTGYAGWVLHSKERWAGRKDRFYKFMSWMYWRVRFSTLWNQFLHHPSTCHIVQINLFQLQRALMVLTAILKLMLDELLKKIILRQGLTMQHWLARHLLCRPGFRLVYTLASVWTLDLWSSCTLSTQVTRQNAGSSPHRNNISSNVYQRLTRCLPNRFLLAPVYTAWLRFSRSPAVRCAHQNKSWSGECGRNGDCQQQTWPVKPSI